METGQNVRATTSVRMNERLKHPSQLTEVPMG